MNRERDTAKRIQRGQRHPLLLQQHLNEQNFWVCIALLAVSAGLLIWDPPPFAPYRRHLLAIAVGSGLILVLTFLYRLRAYVQCREQALWIQLPFYWLTIPYEAIKTTRPTEFYRVFPPEEQRWTQRRFLRWMWGKTVVAVEIEGLAKPSFRLGLWASPYLFDANKSSLILPVRDWMALRLELDETLARRRRG